MRLFGRERVSDANGTHRLSKSAEYKIWRGMKDRCLNPNDPHFAEYSVRGICDLWANSFEEFFAHVGPRPSSKHSIDRIDNSRGYEPGNCRWATASEQNRNKGNARPVIRSDGKQYAHITVAARDVGGDPSRIREVCKGLIPQHKGFGWSYTAKEAS
jgi:hypothetical protein